MFNSRSKVFNAFSAYFLKRYFFKEAFSGDTAVIPCKSICGKGMVCTGCIIPGTFATEISQENRTGVYYLVCQCICIGGVNYKVFRCIEVAEINAIIQ